MCKISYLEEMPGGCQDQRQNASLLCIYVQALFLKSEAALANNWKRQMFPIVPTSELKQKG